VYKIFDNRFHPTYRRPDVWLQNHRPWIADLNVKREFSFKESSTVDTLGKPARKRGHGDDSPPETVSYPRGSVQIIKYEFVNGTHFASRVSHFQQIARCIEDMHKAGIVHGDIRGFNMLHPHPGPGPGRIQQSRLIDFDLCGSPGVDVYPPGYSSRVMDNKYSRSGRANQKMEMYHDWYELASAMAPYRVPYSVVTSKPKLKLLEDWEHICLDFDKTDPDSTDQRDLARLIDNFIEEHGDVEIELPPTDKRAWNEEIKGTGSPNKKKQKSRGST
jgi:hypothetical protein